MGSEFKHYYTGEIVSQHNVSFVIKSILLSSTGGLNVGLWTVANSLGNSLQCLDEGVEAVYRPLLANESTICDLFLELEISLGGIKCIFGTLSHPLYDDST